MFSNSAAGQRQGGQVAYVDTHLPRLKTDPLFGSTYSVHVRSLYICSGLERTLARLVMLGRVRVSFVASGRRRYLARVK